MDYLNSVAELAATAPVETSRWLRRLAAGAFLAAGYLVAEMLFLGACLAGLVNDWRLHEAATAARLTLAAVSIWLLTTREPATDRVRGLRVALRGMAVGLGLMGATLAAIGIAQAVEGAAGPGRRLPLPIYGLGGILVLFLVYLSLLSTRIGDAAASRFFEILTVITTVVLLAGWVLENPLAHVVGLLGGDGVGASVVTGILVACGVYGYLLCLLRLMLRLGLRLLSLTTECSNTRDETAKTEY